MKKMWMLFAVLFLFTGCLGPAKVEQFEEIAPNETAFLVPLEGDSVGGQEKFDSVAFLEAKKVSSKRISLPLREQSTGRWWWQYKWIPAAKVIRVDRAPVTREWTESKQTGSDVRDQAISVESRESIGFKVGITITAMVEEQNTALFLFRFAGKSLAQILDTNMRSEVAEFLTEKFGGMTLDEARLQKATIFNEMTDAVTKKYAAFGITILTMGSSEGLIYDDDKIQQAINDAWSAEREKERADVEAKTKKVRATADADAAVEKAKGQAEAAFLTAQGEAKALIERAKGEAEANKTRAAALTPYLLAQMSIEKWNGVVPVMLGGSVPHLVTEVQNYLPQANP